MLVDLSSWEKLSLCLFLFFFLDFLLNLGNKIVILDLTVIMGFVTCLVVPVLFYHVYTKENTLARIWGKYMPISSDDYFSFALPAILAMTLGLKVQFGKLKINN